MADIARLEQALRNADKAGDTYAAKRFAQEIRNMQGAGAPQQSPQMQSNMAELSSLSQRFDTNNGAPKVVDQNADRMMRAGMEADKLQGMRQQGSIGDFLESAITNLPMGRSIAAIPGGMTRMLTDGVNPVEGYMREKALIDEQMRQRQERSPVADMAGAATGNIAGAIPIVKGAQALGIGLKAGAGLLPRIGAGIAGGGAMGAVSGFDQGVTLDERTANAQTGAGYGAAFGGALPVVGTGLRKVGNATLDKFRTLSNPDGMAAKTVQRAMKFDRSIGGSMSADDLAAARANGQQLTVADIGGRTTKQLAKTATNMNPELRSEMSQQLMDRASTQNVRAVDKLSKIVGGRIDDLAAQESLKTASRKANDVAYKKAYEFNFGARQPMELDGIQSRLPADAVREAMKIAKAEGRSFGEQLVATIDDAADIVQFKRTPSMREWDYIQRGLRSSTDKAFRAGSGGAGTAYKDLRSELLGILDQTNPAFKEARAGAFAAFGADDALDAGKVFARSRGDVGEMAKAVGKLNPAEKKLFETGFASELIDRINKPSDSVDVIKQVFGNPEARQKMVQAFGRQKSAELEAFTRVEATMQATKLAVTSGSQTAQYLFDAGAVGTGATASYLTQDPKYAALGVMLAGARRGNKYLDQRVVNKIGELLMSGDPKTIDRVIANASVSPTYMAALRAITDQIDKIAPLAAGSMAGQVTSQQ